MYFLQKEYQPNGAIKIHYMKADLLNIVKDPKRQVVEYLKIASIDLGSQLADFDAYFVLDP